MAGSRTVQLSSSRSPMRAAKEAISAGFSPGSCPAAPSDVKLCDICGAVGYDEFLAVCTECNERVEHVYCMQALCDSVPLNWVCEGCEKRSYDKIYEEENERLLRKINFKTQNIATTFLCQETKSQNEQCIHEHGGEEDKEQTPSIHGQESKEVKKETSPKIVMSEGFSTLLSADGALQARADNANAGSGTVGCEIALSKGRVDQGRCHHGLKGLVSSKLPSCTDHGLSKSYSLESEPVLSFLLPSRPKELSRNNSGLSNKKVGLPRENVRITVEAKIEHLRKEARLSASGLGIECPCRQSSRNFSHKSQTDMTVETCWRCNKVNSSQACNQSKNFSGNQKDMFGVEASNARQRARKVEAEVIETSGPEKTTATETAKSFEMVHAGTSEKSPSVLKNGSLEVQKPLFHGLLGMQPSVSSSTPRYYARFPVRQGGSHALAVSNVWQMQPRCFHQPQVRPGRAYGPQEFMPFSWSAYGLNVCYMPPQLQAIPLVQKVWRGQFNVSTSANCSMVYNGIQAHPSNKADPKVWEAAQSLPGLLKMKELKRGLDNNTWPQRFLDSPPTSDNIGMFFFPVDMESYDSWYKRLADRLLGHDLVLRAESTSLYLLIFHSQLLPKAEQLWDGRHFLWGVFRTKKSTLTQRTTMVHSALEANESASSNANGEIIDMDIDMVCGVDVQPSTILPPLPPGSPPAKPPPPLTPPHHSDEDGELGLRPERLPSAPPSPPPTPPQCQQEIILESSCNLLPVSKPKPAAQQCVVSTRNVFDRLPSGQKNQLESTTDFVNRQPSSKTCHLQDGQPEQPSSHGDVTSGARNSIQPAPQMSER